MGRPREHDAAVGEALLDAAEDLLAAGGPDAVSVRAVADAVGTTTRAVYSVFGSKAGLLEAIAARGYQLLADLVSAIPETDDPGADLVAVGVAGFRRFAVERPHLFRLTFERVPAEIVATPAVEPARIAAYHALARVIRRAQEHGVVDHRPVAELAFAFHCTCQGLAGGELAREAPPVGARFWTRLEGVDAEALWRATLGALVRGLRPEAG